LGQSNRLSRVKVSKKFQIAIPAEVRRKLGIEAGDNLIVDIRERHILMMRDPKEHPEDFVGRHPELWRDAEDVDAYIRGEREAWLAS